MLVKILLLNFVYLDMHNILMNQPRGSIFRQDSLIRILDRDTQLINGGNF
jgi:hypothetical protein